MDKTYVVLTDMRSVDLNLDHINIRNMMIFPLSRNEAFDLPSPLEYQHYSNKAFFTLATRVHVFLSGYSIVKPLLFLFFYGIIAAGGTQVCTKTQKSFH